jgi:toxin-antitoxin system PIN domain toxin
MIVPDINLLIYAHDSSAAQHTPARKWWEAALSGNEPVGIPVVVVMAFVRLMTHPTLSENPMSVAQAKACIEGWLGQPNCRMLPVGDRTISLFLRMISEAGQGGNLCTDAMIAASAKEYDGSVYSNDRDFDRFPDLRWSNPL